MEKINLSGINLACEISGEGSETILFLNGIAMTIAHWTPMVMEMSSEYRCVCHDFRGQLQSDKPEGPYTLDTHVEETKVLMENLGIEKAHIVGTSYGSEIGMMFAYTYPEACLSLTVIDGVSETDAVLETAVESWKSTALADPVLFYRTIIPWNYSPEFIADHREYFRSREDSFRQLSEEYFIAFASLCDAFLEIDITEKIHAIECPTFVLVGELDILKHQGFARIIADAIPGATLKIVPGAGHAVVIEQPQKLARLILGWLSDF